MTTTKIGADFCLNFNARPSTLQIICNDVDDLGVVPLPSLSWYKDDILAITQDSFGQPSFSEEFLNQGRNGLLRSGALSLPALIAIPATSPSGYGDLFLNFVGLSISDASLLPSGVNASNLDHEVFSVLLGRWECRVNNTFGEDSAITELSDCGKLKLGGSFIHHDTLAGTACNCFTQHSYICALTIILLVVYMILMDACLLQPMET